MVSDPKRIFSGLHLKLLQAQDVIDTKYNFFRMSQCVTINTINIAYTQLLALLSSLPHGSGIVP